MMETVEHLIAGQYELTHLLSDTSLGKLFRAKDLMAIEDSTPTKLHSVLMLSVNPTLYDHPQFTPILAQVLEEFAKPDSPLPVIDACQSSGQYWIIYPDQTGDLLITRFRQFDDKQIPSLTEIQTILLNILRALKLLSPKESLGFLEPSAIFCQGNTYKILTAPIIFTLRLLNKNYPIEKIQKLNLNSFYLSPNIVQGNIPTTQDDTFSLASIAYQLLSGSPAFGQLTPQQALQQNAKPLPLNNIKPELWLILERSLSLKTFTRPAPYELVHAFTESPVPEEDYPNQKFTLKKKPIIAFTVLFVLITTFIAFLTPTKTLVQQAFNYNDSANQPLVLNNNTAGPNGDLALLNRTNLTKESDFTPKTTSINSSVITSYQEALIPYNKLTSNNTANSVTKLTKPLKLVADKPTSPTDSTKFSSSLQRPHIAIKLIAEKITNRKSTSKHNNQSNDVNTNPMVASIRSVDEEAISQTTPVRTMPTHTSTNAEPKGSNITTRSVIPVKSSINNPATIVKSDVIVTPQGANRFVVTKTLETNRPVVQLPRKQILIQTDSNTFVVATD